jgi:hypothetical protein
MYIWWYTVPGDDGMREEGKAIGKKKKILTENSFGILMRISTRLIWGRFDWGRFDLGPI